MPVRRSAGLLVYRVGASGVEVLLGHMGGPLWARRDEGGWTLPKGEYDAASEEPLAAARREFTEELGLPAPDGAVLSLGEVVQAGGKRVVAFAVEGDLDPDTVVPGTFEMAWPPRSGRVQSFPELDRVEWFTLA
ncbi:MAG: NUDIX domain-containing protein, partial [Actinomycetota bacterium]|nr:NUDIX domain-containing protein [Actinomycetota bacterium]